MSRLVRRLLFTSISLCFALAGCSHLFQKPSGGLDAPKLRPPLTHLEAQSRSRQVSRVRYALWFAVNGNYPDYEGRTIIQFDWKGQKANDSGELFLDFSQGQIESLRINDQAFSSEEIARLYSGYRVQLPSKNLVLGLNRVQIVYRQSFSRDGTGLHRFVDPADQLVYLYSNSEPYDANKIFPCFDQPDLKAVYEVTVEAPKDWAVISNAAEREVTKFDGRTSWSFPVTPAFSTYLFALHAGPYEVWKSDSNGIPLRLFARHSLKKYVDAKEWFEITKAGLEFYPIRFGYPYPFIKLDQILVPEFNAGAMENVGAVTFSDHYAFRSKPTNEQLRGRAETILHELAHMWFGNLVTMRWWNGLWLNESFATYASHWAMETLAKENSYFKKVDWARSYRESPGRELFDEKKWAYRTDQSVTTHAIDVAVENTHEAESNFDGITYSKGAAVLKQLAFHLGEEDFQEGLQRYFQKYAYKNTHLFQFIRTLQEASEKPLEKWLKEWVATPGANTVEAEFSCNDQGKVARFELIQGNAPHSSLLRTHRTQLALYDQQSHLKAVIPVTYAGERTPVADAIGKPCPAWVNPNHEDYDYVQTRLDPTTRNFLIQADLNRSPLGGKTPVLTREQLWQALWQSTLQGEFSAASFAEIFFRVGSSEKDSSLLGSLLRRMYSTTIQRPSVSLWIDSKQRSIMEEKLHRLARKQLQHSPAGSDLQRQWWELALRTSFQTEQAQWLSSLLRGKERISGLPLDQDRRWEMIAAWARIPAADQSTLSQAIAEEIKRDPSDSGRKWTLSIQAARGSPETKLMSFEQALSDKTTFSELRQLAGSFTWLGQESLYPWLEDRYFAEFPQVFARRPNEEAATFASGFFPYTCEEKEAEKVSRRLKPFMDPASKVPASVVRVLQSAQEEQERCLQLKKANAAQPSPSTKL